MDLNQLNDKYGDWDWNDYHKAECDVDAMDEKRHFVLLAYSVGLVLSSKERLEAAGISYTDTTLVMFTEEYHTYITANPDTIVFPQYWTIGPMFERYNAYEDSAAMRTLCDIWDKLFPGLIGNVEVLKHFSIYYRLNQYENSGRQ